MYYIVSILLQLRFNYIYKRSNSMVSLIAIISTLGIALGVSVLIVGLSAMNGFKRELNNRILAVIPHGEIELVDKNFYDWKKIISKVQYMSGILDSMPYINFNAVIKSGTKFKALQIRGIDSKQKLHFRTLPFLTKAKGWEKFKAGKQQIILGEGIAKFLHIKRGDWITLMIPNNNNKEKYLLQVDTLQLQVSSILQLNGMLDYTLALIPIADAQKYLKIGNSVSGIELRMSNPLQAQKLLLKVANSIDYNIHINNWMNSYGYIYHDIQMIRAIMYLSMLLVIGVACFNIISTLIIAIKNKSIDIAILKTLGAKNQLIYVIFIYYGLIIGLLGSISGIALGVLIALKLTVISHGLEYIIGHQLLIRDVYFIDFLPSELHWIDVLFILITVLILSLLASWYPAYRASRVNPVNVLNR
ncbi:lipoprotein-releasing ABC transporter permease subunit LolE [Pantoea sp. Mhis]|uniref:lipoprotein-releasing ABC transporter permease subunit LolE n=1 Tax=Pantoea sp. Mhis TaxID=2576759 RepID=UPI001357A54C|nr:lipoprotein-releasing ABC transporter permease subunit LolE [Pantoea sp. Mhis]MXP56319.1 lipoprotein-releasing ABC transporter permease subunit LolE [Pantoea sp. Mhis]